MLAVSCIMLSIEPGLARPVLRARVSEKFAAGGDGEVFSFNEINDHIRNYLRFAQFNVNS